MSDDLQCVVGVLGSDRKLVDKQRKFDSFNKLTYIQADGLKLNIQCQNMQQIMMLMILCQDYWIKITYQNEKLQTQYIILSDHQIKKQNSVYFKIDSNQMLLGYIFQLKDLVQNGRNINKIEFFNCRVYQVILINNSNKLYETLSNYQDFHSLSDFQQRLFFNCVQIKQLISKNNNLQYIISDQKYINEYNRQIQMINQEINKQQQEKQVKQEPAKQQINQKQTINKQKQQTKQQTVKEKEIIDENYCAKNIDLTIHAYQIQYGELKNDYQHNQSIRSLSPVRKIGQASPRWQPLINVKMQKLQVKPAKQLSDFKQPQQITTKQLERENIQGSMVLSQVMNENKPITHDQLLKLNESQIQTIKQQILTNQATLQDEQDCYLIGLIYDPLQQKYFDI